MGVDDGLANRESEADAALGTSPPGIDAIEPVEDSRQVLRRNTNSRVGNGDDGGCQARVVARELLGHR